MAMIKKFLIERLQHPTFKVNALLKTYQPTIWLIGDGRSGTTWISSLLNYDKRFREVFEPFHPTKVDETRFLATHQYMREGDTYGNLYDIASRIFRGNFWNSRTDVDNRIGIYDGLLIKDIFSNLFAKWAYHQFSHIKIIMLIRNPFAVALSKYQKMHWDWVTDPMELYQQEKLKHDFLAPYESFIREISSGNDYILKQILIWSILHYVPFRQFKSGEIKILFYEKVYLNPEVEISNLSDFTGIDLSSLPQDVIKKPSKVVGDNFSQSKSPLDSWQESIPPETIARGKEILAAFHLHHLYGDNAVPEAFDIDLWNRCIGKEA